MFFAPASLPPKPPANIVFVHGTHRTGNALSFNYSPLKPYLSHPAGLYKFSDCDDNFCFKWVMKQLIEKSNGLFNPEYCHIFCWSGQLSHKARIEAAQNLHNELIKLYRKNPDIPLIIFTHSHGGNVVLNLAGINEEKPYSIDSLVLLACPVQEKTKSYIFDDLFKEIFSIYSSWDMIQVLDPQGIYYYKEKLYSYFTNQNQPTEPTPSFFSERLFPQESKVKHICLKRMRPISHLEFLLPTCTSKYPEILYTTINHDFTSGPMEYQL